MPTDLLQQVAARVAAYQERVEGMLERLRGAETPSAFRGVEEALAVEARRLSDDIAGDILAAKLNESAFQARACAAAYAHGKLRSGGSREVGVRLLGGGECRVRVPYLKADRRGRPGRRRGSGRRGRGGSGLYPTLAALGIWDGVSPALATEIARQVTACDSVRSGRQSLARRDIDLGHKQTLRIVGSVGSRAVAQREAWLASIVADDDGKPGPLAGKRILLSTDGGRCRMRIPAKCGRRRKSTRHRGFHAPWQEPKLLVIYVLDDNGRVDQTYRPVIDGTMGNCDAVFRMMLGYLKALGAAQAAQIIVTADGAKWIWERVDELASQLGIERSKVIDVIDWFHAVETLHTIAAVPSRWPKGTGKRKWIRRAKKLLHAGRIAGLVEHIRSLAVGRRAKKILCHVDYFERNTARMQYASFEAQAVPIGSGAMESAVRRVVNLRMKGNGKFWLPDNAEAMLMLRSYLKADRFDDLIDWSLSAAVPWWSPSCSPIEVSDVASRLAPANDNEGCHTSLKRAA